MKYIQEVSLLDWTAGQENQGADSFYVIILKIMKSI